MTGPLAPGATIGILGGGQLGRMLAVAAARLGYRTVILERGDSCPAAQVANEHIDADYTDRRALDRLAELCDVVTYEFENVPVAAVQLLGELLPVYPPSEALEAAQDRLSEKIFLNSAGISTAPFFSVDNDDDLERGLDELGGSGVLKTRRMGYDGKGQQVFRAEAPSPVRGTFERMGGVPLILEGLVHFAREISIIAARGADGVIATYDPAENTHRNGILHRSTVPADISPETRHAVQEAAHSVLATLDYIGVIGIEFFVLKDGTLLANEMAPRVHNSGHWTEAACAVSQFEQHIRAVAGLPLGATARHSDCEMTNLLGAEQCEAPTLLREQDLVLHLYGKAEARAGRKMGHYTRLFRPGGNKAG